MLAILNVARHTYNISGTAQMNICWYAVSLILFSGGIGGISGGIGGNGGEGGEQGGNGGAGQGPTFIGKICFPESVTIGLDLALNVLQFGSWAHALAAGQPYTDWSVTMALPPATNFQYKCEFLPSPLLLSI